MKKHTSFALICLSLLLFATSLVAQTNVSAQTPPAIPEEARKHFVMGTTLFKDAKTADDFAAVESEFKQAADLAPQWPDARYNLALAKEAAGDYSGAMADLKLYQKFKLSDSEARTVQDKIYALEAKAGAAAKQHASDGAATAKEAAARAEEAKYGWLQGEWSSESEHGNWGASAATGTAQAKKIDNIVEIGPINDYARPIGDLRAIVGESGNISWDFRFATEQPGGCMYGKHLPVAVTIGRDQRTIRFQVDSYAGTACDRPNLPFMVTLTRR
jgi:hypothetical protein